MGNVAYLATGLVLGVRSAIQPLLQAQDTFAALDGHR